MSAQLLKNPAFCVLPFITRFQDTSGHQHLCCYSSENIDYSDLAAMQSLKSKLLVGEKISHCNACYSVEQQGAISPRLRETARWLRDSEVKSYIQAWHDQSPDQIWFYDLRYDNKCNLACIGCGPRNSSLWAKELGVTVAKHTPPWSLDDILKSKKIYMAGGEPLIIESFIDVLKAVSELETQPEVVINTNLTSVTDDLEKTLAKIKKLTLTVSVDAYGAVNEYHRWPLKWNKFIRNLEWAKSINCTIMFNTVVDAVSIMGIPELVSIEHYADHWDLDILVNPPELQVENLPTSVKKLMESKWDTLKNSKFYTKDVIFKSRVDTVLTLLAKSGQPEILTKYINDIDQRRNLKHKDFLGIELT